MAGHSKFKNIMHKKGKADAARAKLFTKLAREITTAARAGLPDPAMNPRLRLAVQNARAASMPKDRIERSIASAAGAGGADYEAVRYEGFGPGGVGVIVEALTDNRNRTAGELRAVFSRNGGNLGAPNSVASGFARLGEIRYRRAAASEDAMLEAAIEAGAEDCASEEETHVVTCAFEALNDVSAALAARFGDAESAAVVWRPHNLVEATGETAQAAVRLLDLLDDLDDVQTVFANLDLSEETLAALGASA